MDETNVSVPYSRIVLVATTVGSQDAVACPPHDNNCFLQRALAPYLNGDPVDNECRDCWLHYILVGD